MNETCLWVAIILLVIAAALNLLKKPHEMAMYFLGLAFVILSLLVEKVLVTK